MTVSAYFQALLITVRTSLLWLHSSAWHGFFLPLWLTALALHNIPHKAVPLLRTAGRTLLYALAGLLVYTLILPFFSGYMHEDLAGHVLLLLLTALYAVLCRDFSPASRIVIASAMFATVNWILTIVHMILFFYMPLAAANYVQLGLLLVCFGIVRLFRPPADDRPPRVYPLIMLAIAVISFVCLLSVRIFESADYGAGANQPTLRIILPLFSVVHLLIYVLYCTLTREHQRAQALSAIHIRQARDLEFISRSQALTEQLHALRHELKNHFTAMDLLLREKKYDQLSAYFESVLGENAAALDTFHCANPLITALVANAVSTAAADGVRLDSTAAVPPTLPVADADLVSLLSNLIDNGVEGCQRAGGDWVRLSVRTEKDYLFITVTNPASGKLADNPKLKTTKRDPRAHGFGIPIIRRIAQKYNGCAVFESEDGIFRADVMLCLDEAETEDDE